MRFNAQALNVVAGTFVLAVVYAVVGKLSLLLAVPPGYATALFPPAGIALGALLAGGNKHWPGVLLGSLCMNLWVSADIGPLTQVSFVLAAAIATGSTAQALLGAYLVRRFVGVPVLLDQEKEVFRFVVLGAALASLCSASVGVTALFLVGAISAGDYPYSWWNWWIGDALGVLIATPLTLILIGAPRRLWQPRWRTVGVPMLVTLAGVIALFLWGSERERQRLRAEFSLTAQALAGEFWRRGASCLDIVDYLERFFGSSATVSRAAFQKFTGDLSSHCVDLRSVSWNPRVTAAERTTFEAAAREQGMAGFQITERDSAGKIQPAVARSEYFPVNYVEPLVGNEAAVGFDTVSESVRRRTLEQARDIGRATSTGRVSLVQEPRSPAITLIYNPVYRQPATTVEERRQHLRGFVAAAVNVGALVSEVAKTANDPTIVLQLVDNTEPSVPKLLAGPEQTPAGPNILDLIATTRYEIAGLRWDLYIAATPAYLASHRIWQAWVVLAGGLLFTGLMGGFLLLVSGRTARIERLVEERTNDLSQALRVIEESEQRFTALANTSPVMMWMEDSSGKPLLFNAAWLEFSGHSLEQELALHPEGYDLHPDDLVQCHERYHRHRKERTRFTHEYRSRNRSGQFRWIEETAVPRFSPSGEYLGHIGVSVDITARKDADAAIQAALKEKDVLLGEIHHRVKNNLQIVCSLLNLQLSSVKDGVVMEMLRDSQNRISSMALIHQTLYESKDFSHVDFSKFLVRLTTSLRNSYGIHPVQLVVSAQPVLLRIDTAIPLGLIVNELVSNAFKHAYPGKTGGEIRVELDQSPEGRVGLAVSDDGAGLPEKLNIEDLPSLGLQLVQILTQQVHGTLTVNRRKPTRFQVDFVEREIVAAT